MKNKKKGLKDVIVEIAGNAVIQAACVMALLNAKKIRHVLWGGLKTKEMKSANPKVRLKPTP